MSRRSTNAEYGESYLELGWQNVGRVRCCGGVCKVEPTD